MKNIELAFSKYKERKIKEIQEKLVKEIDTKKISKYDYDLQINSITKESNIIFENENKEVYYKTCPYCQGYGKIEKEKFEFGESMPTIVDVKCGNCYTTGIEVKNSKEILSSYHLYKINN